MTLASLLTSMPSTFGSWIWVSIRRWHSRRRAKTWLEAWPDDMLKDIGIARSEIDHAVRSGRNARHHNASGEVYHAAS
jgi:uncharacterized protein YjiS (DUF1127 family)